MDDQLLPAPVIEPSAALPVDDNTVKFKRSHLYATLLPLAFVLGLSVGYLFWGRTPAVPAAAAANQAAAAQAQDESAAQSGSQEVRRYDVPVDDDPSLGPRIGKNYHHRIQRF